MIDRCRIVGPRRVYELALPRPARGISRMRLDDILLRRAAANGAARLDGSTATAVSSDAVTLGDGRRIEAAAVVGAWGRWGRFDQQLQRRFVHDRSHRSFGFKRHYTGAHPSGTIGLYSFGRGYLGVNAVEGGAVNICGLVHASRLSGHRGRWDAFIELIRSQHPELDHLYSTHEPAQDAFLSSEPVVFRARDAVENGVFMIGDASGVIDPLTGNGMAMAIQSALLLAPTLVRLVETRARRGELENTYRDEHRRLFRKRIAWSRGAALLLSRPRLLHATVSLVRTPAAGELFVRRTRASTVTVERLLSAWFR